jgi:hypothetical protein
MTVPQSGIVVSATRISPGRNWPELSDVGDHPSLARRDLATHRAPRCEHLATAFEPVLVELAAGLAGGDRFRPSLNHVELAVDAVARPLDVHRHRMTGLGAVVLLDPHRGLGQFEHVGVVQAKACALAWLGRHVTRRIPAAIGCVHHPHFLAAEAAPQHGPLAVANGRLEHVELVRVDRTLHHVLPKTICAGDEDDVAKPGLGVEGEDHAGTGEVRAHHFHHADRQPDLEVVEAVFDAVDDRAVHEQAGEAPSDTVEERGLAGNVEVGFMLAQLAPRLQDAIL